MNGPLSLVLAEVTGTQVTQALISGVALGAKYALIALGFVVVFRSTGVINFANGAFVLVGAYLTYNFSVTWGLDFYLSLAMSMAAGLLLGIALEWLVLRRLVGEAVFTVIMVTIGILYVMDNLVTAIWGPENLTLNDPWVGKVVRVGDLTIPHRDLWAIGFAGVVLLGFLVFFRFSRLGLAMRATALDPEAALAQGIDARLVYRAAWGIAGMVAALAGTTFATSSGLQPSLGVVALAAFPAMILGGLDSPLGAVVGGLVIGVVQQLAQLLAPEYIEWAGVSVQQVVPYLVMVAILLVRPYGLFGTREVRRGLMAVVSFPSFRRRDTGGDPNRALVLRYADDLRLFPGRWARAGLAALLVALRGHPRGRARRRCRPADARTDRDLRHRGHRAEPVVGLHRSGQPRARLLRRGRAPTRRRTWAPPRGIRWSSTSPAAALLGFAIGALVGPFALRLRGNYLVIVTLGLVFIGRHVFYNWDSVTGGNRGARIRGADLTVGPIDLEALQVGGRDLSREAGLFWLVWALVALGALLAKNLVRVATRAGDAGRAGPGPLRRGDRRAPGPVQGRGVRLVERLRVGGRGPERSAAAPGRSGQLRAPALDHLRRHHHHRGDRVHVRLDAGGGLRDRWPVAHRPEQRERAPRPAADARAPATPGGSPWGSSTTCCSACSSCCSCWWNPVGSLRSGTAPRSGWRPGRSRIDLRHQPTWGKQHDEKILDPARGDRLGARARRHRVRRG